jgi:hypothetical protein
MYLAIEGYGMIFGKEKPPLSNCSNINVLILLN